MEFGNYFLYLTMLIWLSFLAFSLLGYLVFKKWLYKRNLHRKIFTLETKPEQWKFELGNSIVANLVIMASGVVIYFLHKKGWTQLYFEADKFSYWYLILNFFIIHTLHDTYFYWTHRAMHEVPFLKRIHVEHHRSRIPTALAATSFSAGEAFIHGLFYILVVMIVPVHWAVLTVFYVFLTWISTWGHMEFEFWPNFLYRFPYSYSFNSLTAHNLHHYYGSGNYSLYYRFWDEVCGTTHPKTYEHFYETRKRIQEHFGKTESIYRPHPNDQAGLYFEELLNYGEDINIYLGPVPFNSAPTIYKSDRLLYVPHRHCDGISAVKLIHQWKGLQISAFPEVNRQEKLRKDLKGLLSIAKLLAKLLISFPYRGFGWRHTNQNRSEVVVLNFSKEESAIFFERMSETKCSVNSFLIWAITQASADSVKKFRWLIPVWLPKARTSIAQATIRNHSSLIELDLTSESSLQEVHQKIQSGLELNGPWFWAKSFDLLNVFLKYPFKILVWLSLVGLKRTGTISNLGRFEGNFEGPVMFVPPALKNAPVAFGILTYNGQLTVSVQTKPGCGPDSAELENILSQIKGFCLN